MDIVNHEMKIFQEMATLMMDIAYRMQTILASQSIKDLSGGNTDRTSPVDPDTVDGQDAEDQSDTDSGMTVNRNTRSIQDRGTRSRTIVGDDQRTQRTVTKSTAGQPEWHEDTSAVDDMDRLWKLHEGYMVPVKDRVIGINNGRAAILYLQQNGIAGSYFHDNNAAGRRSNICQRRT